MSNTLHTFFQKFLSTTQEYTIGRIQFIVRFVVVLGIATLIWIAISPFIQIPQNELTLLQQGLPVNNPHKLAFGNLSWVIVYGFFYYILYILASKRYVDIGWTNRTPKILIGVFIIFNLWSFGLGAYSGYFGNPILGFIQGGGLIGALLAGVGGLAIGSLICIGIMIFLCCIVPGLENNDKKI